LYEKQIVLVATSLSTTTRMSNQNQPVLDGNPRTIDADFCKAGWPYRLRGRISVKH